MGQQVNAYFPGDCTLEWISACLLAFAAGTGSALPAQDMTGTWNGTMADLTGFFQNLVLDKPIVDHAGLTERFDCHVTFAHEDSQFKRPPFQAAARNRNHRICAEPLEALQQQLGLKLTAEETPVDVLVIDPGQKHSEN